MRLGSASDAKLLTVCVLSTVYCLLTACSTVLFEKLTGLQLVKKFPAFYGTQRFTTAFITARHLSLSWASSIQSIPPNPTSWRFIFILSSHLRLGLPSDLFPSGFPTKTLYTTFPSPIRATWPAHLILLDFITRTILGEKYRSLSSSLRSFLHPPVVNSLFLFPLALQPPLGLVFYSPVAGFSLLVFEVSWSHTTTRHSR